MYEAKAYKGSKQGSLLVPAALGGNQGNPWVFITLALAWYATIGCMLIFSEHLS